MTISATSDKAVEHARASILETIPATHVGDFISGADLPHDDQDLSLASLTFTCTNPGYPGWYWDVTVVAVNGSDDITVSEINLLPGADALVPAQWTPWSDRIEAGDLGVGDLLPTKPGDDRLTAGLTGLDEKDLVDEPLFPHGWEIGLGREQILSTVGLERAVDRWMNGQTGPKSAMAKAAPKDCGSCGYMMTIGGSLGQAFGVCANEFGAADGQIVSLTFGCGAHSSVKPVERPPIPVVPLVIDDISDDQADGSQLPDYVEEVVEEPVTLSDEEVAAIVEAVEEDAEPTIIGDLGNEEIIIEQLDAAFDVETENTEIAFDAIEALGAGDESVAEFVVDFYEDEDKA